ncbi:MAG: patatin-like phospholipase family protein [Neisseria zoodegmatis]|uniref:patatin-like phospholipase family protein n=1 Tax=Neisseria zoodegmatis TaxID=326523 RepID=UPI0026F01C9A|nr:patatin-like phospholipase family protein [Neisseria zoodegmatis]MDO5070256.1 patatin-like phospholipase family protein [Neisseria zoodegmatis]
MDKIGLVLSGGGAKGAYQVGLMKALNDLDIQIDAIAGASIGALNSAVLASAPNIRLGTENLEKLWNKLPHIKPLQFRGNKELASLGIYLSLLVSQG